MSKDQWIADHERVLQDWEDGEVTLDDAGERLRELGFDPHEIREQLQSPSGYPIPKGYFGKEREEAKP